MRAHNPETICQATHFRDASALVSRSIARLYRLHGFLRKRGFRATIRKTYEFIFQSRHSVGDAVAPKLPAPDESLNLQSGEWIEIKSYEEIGQTLDGQQRHRGMLFMPEMVEYCGRRLRVHKAVNRILLEETGEVRRLRNTVLLEGSTCSGLSVGCDRSCFHFWREAWLRRVPAAETPEQQLEQ